ncbi:MAG: hypothetical protein ACYC7A_12750 [Thermoanaerobaculia bacterium]
MMRLLVATALILLTPLQASPAEPAFFPPPIGGARGVSQSTLGPAVGDQGLPHIASNGEVAIAMWRDMKEYGWATRVSPLDASGSALDPIGTLINDGGSPEGIYWNGTEFVAMTVDETKRTRVRLTPEGQVIDSVVLGMPVGFRLTAISEDGQRLLFVEQRGMRAAIADRHGEMAGEPVALAPLPEGGAEAFVHGWVGAERDGEFLVVRVVWHETIGNLNVYVLADRIDASGHPVSSMHTTLQLEYSDYVYALGGGGDGYLFVAAHRNRGTVTAYSLDASGVFSGTPMTLAAYDPNRASIAARPVIVRDGSRYLVVWQPAFNWGETEIRMASIPDGASSAPESQDIASWNAYPGGLAFAKRGSDAIALASVRVYPASTGSDLYSIRISPQMSGDPPRLVAASRTAQKRIEAAAGDNGFGVIWVEDGPDSATRVFFRRFSRSGMPQGEPIEVDEYPAGANSIPALEPAIVSNGQVYLLLWKSDWETRGRRMDSGGTWIDAEAFPLTSKFVAPGVTAGREEVAIASPRMLERIRFSGEPIAGTTTLPGEYSHDSAVATNGDEFLVVWSEGLPPCQYLCLPIPYQILAVRVSADGTLLDSVPIVLEDRAGYADLPSVAWAGDRYLVVWSDSASVRGATLSPEGVVLDANPASMPGISLHDGEPDWDMIPRVVADGDTFVLVTSAKSRYQYYSRPRAVEGLRFRYDTPLRTVAGLGRRTVAERAYGIAPAVARGADGRLLVGWIAEAEPDRAPRAFFQIFGEQPRLRPVRP